MRLTDDSEKERKGSANTNDDSDNDGRKEEGREITYNFRERNGSNEGSTGTDSPLWERLDGHDLAGACLRTTTKGAGSLRLVLLVSA